MFYVKVDPIKKPAVKSFACSEFTHIQQVGAVRKQRLAAPMVGVHVWFEPAWVVPATCNRCEVCGGNLRSKLVVDWWLWWVLWCAVKFEIDIQITVNTSGGAMSMWHVSPYVYGPKP